MTNAVNLASAAGTGFAFRNRIINGDMRIDQRNGGGAVTPSATSAFVYTLDRWWYFGTQASKFTIQKNAGSVTPPAGFTNYIGLTVSSAVTPSASDQFIFGQSIEGFNFSDLGFGTATAKSITVSFWVRSSLTGQFSVALENLSGTRTYAATYTITSANTWQYVTVTIPGATSGTWETENSLATYVMFDLGVGSNQQTTANTWYNGAANAATGNVKIVSTAGATFYLTGVQLEVGSVATPFERRPYGLELALCQRYYETCAYDIMTYGYVSNGNTFYKYTPFNVTKRTAPTMSFTNVGVNGFSNSAATNLSQVNGISWLNVANYTGAGSLYSIVSWAASAEL